MLEFYPVTRPDQLPLPSFFVVPDVLAFRWGAGVVLLASLLSLAGCASLSGPPPAGGGTAARGSADAEPPPANVNLSGFPLPYRQGYADGCASGDGRERKDAERFAADGNYRTGWLDGRAICGRR